MDHPFPVVHRDVDGDVDRSLPDVDSEVDVEEPLPSLEIRDAHAQKGPIVGEGCHADDHEGEHHQWNQLHNMKMNQKFKKLSKYRIY